MADLGVERSTAWGRVHLRGSVYDESRDNGTRLQENETEIRQASAGADWSTGRGSLTLRAWASDQDFRQTFTAVSADRTRERLTRSQVVPAESLGLSAQGTRALGERHALVGGLELREVSGDSDELIFTDAGVSRTVSGGRQWTGALFLEDLVTVTPRLSLTLGGRVDRWENDGERRTGGTSTRFPARDETAASPRASLLFRATDRWRSPPRSTRPSAPPP